MKMISASVSSQSQDLRAINLNIKDGLGFNISQNQASQELRNSMSGGREASSAVQRRHAEEALSSGSPTKVPEGCQGPSLLGCNSLQGALTVLGRLD